MNKKLMLFILTVVHAMAMCAYTVGHRPDYFFENTNDLITATTHEPAWVVVSRDGSTNTNVPTAGKPLVFHAMVQSPGKTVAGWGEGPGKANPPNYVPNIKNLTWVFNQSTNYVCNYNASFEPDGRYLFVMLRYMKYGLVLNQGDGLPSIPLGTDICYTNMVTLPSPERVGYDFVGWTNAYKVAALNGDVPSAGEVFNVCDDGTNVMLFAKWEPKKFNVTFVPNGDNATVSPTSKQVTYDSLYGDLPTPMRPSYAFAGWFTEAEAGVQVQSNTVVSITENQTLYAQWHQLFTVTFQNTSGTVYKKCTDVPYGSSVMPPDDNEVDVPAGRVLIGWTPDEYSNVTRNLTIYPDFRDIQPTLTFSWSPTAGGSIHPDILDGAGQYQYGRTVRLTVTPNIAYDFAGWSDGVLDNPRDVIVIADTNLVAQFSLKKFTVTFLDWDGTTTNDTRIVEYGSAADAPSPIEYPGYTFTSWSVGFANVTSDLVTVAQYSPNRYTVVYDANGGSGAMTNDVFTYGVEYGLQSNTYTRAVNQFCGWVSAPNATQAEYDDGSVVSNLTTVADDICNLYAVWTSSLTPYSIAADCTNLVLECIDENHRWIIDYQSGCGSTSCVYAATGEANAKMQTTLVGMGTLTFCVKIHSEEVTGPFSLYENEMTPNFKQLKDTADGWMLCALEKNDNDVLNVEWVCAQQDNAKCWVDQVHWYPGRFVTVGSSVASDREENEIKEAILQRWDAILGESASTITHVVATGSLVTNAVALLNEGSVPKVTPNDATTATLEFSENMSRTVPVPSIADLEYTGDLLAAVVPEDDRYVVSHDGGTNVGVYQVVLSLTDTNSYCWAGGRPNPLTLTFNITKATNAWVQMPYILGWTNGEEPSEPNMGEARFGVVGVMYGVQGSTMAPSLPDAPGDYIAEFAVEATANYDGLTTNIAFTISKSGKETKLEEVFAGMPATVAPDGNGGWKVTVTNDIDSSNLPVEISDNLGAVTIDINGHNLAGEDGKPAIRIVHDEGAGPATQLTVGNGGASASVKGGEGAPAIEAVKSVQEGTKVNIGAGVSVQGGGVPAIDCEVGTNDGDVEKVEVVVPAIAGVEYTGELQTADVPASALYAATQNDGGRDAGDYPVVLELADTNNYCWAGGDSNPTSLTFTITQATNEWATEPSMSTNYWIYGEAPGEPDLGAAKFGEVSVAYRSQDGGALETAFPDEPGEYVAVFSVPETENWTGLAEEIPFEIASLVDENLKVGKYSKIMIADLGYELVPTNGAPYSVVAKGLPAGLKLKYNAVVKNKKGKVVTKAKTTWWIEGVPTAALNYDTNPPYLVITAGGKTETYALSMEVFAQKVTDLGEFPLGTAINEQYFLPGVVKGWTVSGLPAGLKYTAKKLTKKSGKKTVTVAEAYAVYGKTTKAGLFTITAKKKVSGFYETLKFRMLVTPKAVDAAIFSDSLTNLTTMAYVPVSWYLTNDVATVGGKVTKVTGLPTGLSFAAANVYGYTNAKKKTGKYLKREGQTILGTPTKAGIYAVTFTKTVKGKAKTAQILWTVVTNSAELALNFNTAGGVIEGGTVGLKYGDLLAFTATDDAKVTASGLPKGISLVKLGDGSWGFSGFTTKAGTYLVTVTATLKGKTVRQRVALKVDGLPSWAKGTFNGVAIGDDGATNGLATVAVSSVGKISGKFYHGGTNWILSAACYTARSGDAQSNAPETFTCSNVVAKYAYKVTTKVNGKKKTVTKYVTRTFTLTVVPDDLGGAMVLEEEDGSTVQAWQNLWGSTYKTVGKRLFTSKSGKKTLAYRTFTLKGASDSGAAIGLTDAMTLSLKVTTAGAVTATMTYNTGKTSKGKVVYYKPTCATVVIPRSAATADKFTGEVSVYFEASPKNGFDERYVACVPIEEE